MLKVSRPVAFETETRKNGSRDSITGSDIDVHCIYYREYWFPHCMFASDGVLRFGLGLKTSHLSSLSLEILRSWSRSRVHVLEALSTAKIWLSETFVNQRVFGLLYLQIRNNQSR